MNKIIKQIQNDKTHAGIPFWSWNDKLEEDELRRQIRNMKDLGMRGFFMHARGGLETGYMSKDWFDCVRVCIDEAKNLGMEAWAYDENGWPSGFAGGELLKNPENHAAFLICETAADFPEAAEDLLGVYHVTENGVTRLDEPCGISSYTVIKRGRDFSYVDVLNPAVTAQFIEKTHAVYQRETGDDFGHAMPGFFTDEPQYYRWGTPWSDTFRTVFYDRFGYDVLTGLPALFMDYEGAEEFRYDYHLLLHECFMQHFAKPIYDWCEANGVQLTGHGIEEWGLAAQMMCCGGVMPFYCYQHIPGIDYLGRGVKDITGAKQLGSVCEQIGREVRLSEMFACCGWDVTPRELKRIADVQFVGGVNLICEHLYPYSERGQRKRDYPNHYSEHNPWQAEYRDFETHFTHLGALLAQGHEVADTLVIHPIHSAYLHYKHNDYGTVVELDRQHSALAERLTHDQIPFHYGDETMLRDLGRVEGPTIRIGSCRYDKVIVPFCYTLDGTTASLLRQYRKNGGRLLLWEGCPDRVDGRKADLSFLVSNMTYEELKASSAVTVTCDGAGELPIFLQIRQTEAGRIFYLTNPSETPYLRTEITVKHCDGLTLLDPLTLNKALLAGRKNPDGSVTVVFDFDDSASCVLLEEECTFLPMQNEAATGYVSLDGPFTLVGRPENALLLDEAAIALNGGVFSEVRPIVRIRDELLRQQFEGDVTLRFAFTVEDRPRALVLVAEPLRYREITVNGHPITLTADHGRFDRRFLGAEIASLVREGENTVTMSLAYQQREEVYRVLNGGGSESLRNCLAFDTEIEDVYLFGDFGVKVLGGFTDGGKPNTCRAQAPFVLTARSDQVNLSDIVKDGYPFFAGTMTVETELSYKPGDPTRLSLNGRYATCRVAVNGEAVGGNLFSHEWELVPHLREGKNTLLLTLTFSNRNLFGPHHRKDPEPFAVTPNTFSFEKEWKGGGCLAYIPAYAFVRFGASTAPNP